MSSEVPGRRGGAQHIPRPGTWRLGAAAPWAHRSTVAGAGDGAVRLDALLDAVGSRAPARLVPRSIGARNSAVLIVLHDGSDGAEVLFTKRAEHLRDHKGEMSFPGGRMEPGETAREAALREAWEEVDLDPALVRVHGELDHLSTLVSNSYIVPVVATVSTRPALRAHAAEVDRILWVPLDELARADTYREEWWGLADQERAIHFFELDDETIWGATARILHQLLRLAHGVDEPEPPAW